MNAIGLDRPWFPLLAGGFALYVVFARAGGPNVSMRWAGLFVAALGLAGVVISRYTLGRSFSVTPKATALVTHGIYSRIRNPIYVCGVFFVAGILLIFQHTVFWLVLLILIPFQVIRARREGHVLEEKFGDAYRQYRTRTWF